jgi:hypothetical protein
MAKKLKVYNGASWEDVTFAITPPTTNVTNSFTTNQVIDASTSVAALRVTQRGTGEALRVEDDTNPDSTPFVVTATGNVGIGTSTPDRPLKISGATATIGIVATSTGGAEISIDAPNNSNGFAQIDVGGANALRFNTNAAERLRITSGGLVGIGTASPDSALHIAAGGDTTINLTKTGQSTWYIQTLDAGAFRLYSGTANAERLKIDSAGNVIIGGAGLNLTNGKIIINSTSSVTGANWAEAMLHITGVNAADSHPGLTWHAPGASAISLFHTRGTQAIQIMGNGGGVDTTAARMTIRNIAISTSNPSGGADGDMWAVYV